VQPRELQNTLDVRRNVVREIRRYRPDVVIAPDPQRYYFDSGYINHADHRAAGLIALDAVFPVHAWREEEGRHVERYRRLRLSWDDEDESENERTPAT